jgi:hypothetical protein
MNEYDYKYIVEHLAQVVVDNNIQKVRKVNNDSPEEAERILNNFADYNSNADAVQIILDCYMADIVKRVKEKQLFAQTIK